MTMAVGKRGSGGQHR